MTSHKTPVVGTRYTTECGKRFEVIGFGTRGVVVEHHNGNAELIEPDAWQAMRVQHARPAPNQF